MSQTKRGSPRASLLISAQDLASRAAPGPQARPRDAGPWSSWTAGSTSSSPTPAGRPICEGTFQAPGTPISIGTCPGPGGPRHGPSSLAGPGAAPSALRRLRHRPGAPGSWPTTKAGGGLAARLWWLLRWMGHRPGRPAGWRVGRLAEGRPAAEPGRAGAAAPARFEGQPGHMPVLHTAEVAAGLAGDAIRLLDVRAEERFLGRVEPIDPVAGHVPGALNVPFAGNLTADNRFQTAEHLAQRYAPIVAAARARRRSSACAVPASRRVTGSSPWNSRACRAPPCTRAPGASGSGRRTGRWPRDEQADEQPDRRDTRRGGPDGQRPAGGL